MYVCPSHDSVPRENALTLNPAPQRSHSHGPRGSADLAVRSPRSHHHPGTDLSHISFELVLAMENITGNPELAQDILQLVHQRLRQERQESQRLLKLQVSAVVRYGPNSNGLERFAALNC